MTRILMALGVTPSRTPRHRKPGRPSIRPARPVARDAGSARPLVLIAVVVAALIAGVALPAGTGAILAVGLVAVWFLALNVLATLGRTLDARRAGAQ